VAETAAQLAWARGEPERAVAFCAASDRLVAELGIARAALDQTRFSALLDTLRGSVPAPAWARAWEHGRAAALADLLGWSPPAPQAAPATQRIPAAPDSLSEREIQVLRLLARGMTNAEIAAALVVSQFTVKAHVRSIFGKLDVKTRTAAARCAHERGLV